MHKNTNLQSDTGPILNLSCHFNNSIMSRKNHQAEKDSKYRYCGIRIFDKSISLPGHNVVMC